ncbi:DUF4367 domain-containing protein [Clostridium sp. MT-14]|uniref:DUF4367 domain-containing protein n=1 Tax=Clostridium aromativorans TaxID=2836848 RepID=A0ABS8N8S9_9CLOT|nr:DUF4367 domain-containing protein [Clostridium aromativorans]MCC9296217.1 DUF4367 domain-containing protein [Clostridium aromativorans]CAB1244750.1 conserved exported hypothetical protein [Clostridiaceae bacterium BL-3]
MNKLKYKKIILAVTLISVMLIVTSVFAFNNIKESKNTNDSTSSNKTISSKNFNSRLTDFKTEDEINKNIKVKIKEPKYKHANMKQINVQGQRQNNSLGSFDLIVMTYKGDDEKYIRIQEAQDTGKPEDLLTNSKKISINDTEAWVYGDEKGDNYKQIMFWKNGTYYNVASDIELNELIKVAESIE